MANRAAYQIQLRGSASEFGQDISPTLMPFIVQWALAELNVLQDVRERDDLRRLTSFCKIPRQVSEFSIKLPRYSTLKRLLAFRDTQTELRSGSSGFA